MNGSMETVLDIVIPYIHDGDDRNSISSVSRRFYELDCITRKHLTVHAHYATNPSRVSQRFPFIDSLTLKGLPYWDFPLISGTDLSQWIEQICVEFDCLKALHIRGMYVCDLDLKRLAERRGKDLWSLKICKCRGFSTVGLMHVSKYCNDLRTLWLQDSFCKDADGKDGKWLRELALHNKVIESLHFNFDINDVNDLTLIAKNYSNSLVSLRISRNKPLNNIGDAFRHAIKLEDFDGAVFEKDGDYSSFKFPPRIRCLGIEDMPVSSLSFLLPYVNQLQELYLTFTGVGDCCQCFLIERCPNLEVLFTDDDYGDMGLRVIGQVCKKLRKLTHYRSVTHIGLIALVQGCTNLEYLELTLSKISNEAMECVGTHLKNLRDFRMDLYKDAITDSPLDNGIRALLMGSSKLRRLHFNHFQGRMTDVSLGYIGKYGLNLRSLFLRCTGESDAGLLELSKGCPQLRKLSLEKCPFSQQAVATYLFNIDSLRYIRVKNCFDTVLALTRPTSTAELHTEVTQYVLDSEKLMAKKVWDL